MALTEKLSNRLPESPRKASGGCQEPNSFGRSPRAPTELGRCEGDTPIDNPNFLI
jgi:hypothetical protein